MAGNLAGEQSEKRLMLAIQVWIVNEDFTYDSAVSARATLKKRHYPGNFPRTLHCFNMEPGVSSSRPTLRGVKPWSKLSSG
jgi:hypothetical protein